MKFKFLMLALMVVLFLNPALMLSAKPFTDSPAHKAAVKKCNEDYRQAVSEARRNFQIANRIAFHVLDQKEAHARARRERSKALAAARAAKSQCVAAAPK